MTDIERFNKIIKEMSDLYSKKNSNYGNSFEKLWGELGPVSGLVPLHNKLDRLTNLTKGGKNNFESIEDTLIDLANYAIMNLIEIQKDKEKIRENKGPQLNIAESYTDDYGNIVSVDKCGVKTIVQKSNK